MGEPDSPATYANPVAALRDSLANAHASVHVVALVQTHLASAPLAVVAARCKDVVAPLS